MSVDAAYAEVERITRREAVALEGVPELVDHACVAIECANVRAERPREEDGTDGKVLACRPSSNLCDLHDPSHSA